jgi:hypothetical protein
MNKTQYQIVAYKFPCDITGNSLRANSELAFENKERAGIVTLAREERERTMRGADFHAAATTSRHVVIAAARSTRCDCADVRWRWTPKVLYTAAWAERNFCSEQALLKRCILRSRCRVG